MNRHEVTELITAARVAQGRTWRELAEAIGRPIVWTTSALLGQHPFDAASAQTIVDLLGLPAEAKNVLTVVPMRGSLDAVPADPTIYRLHEAIQVYGPAIKEVIHEDFGDGIMSAINFSLDVSKQPHEGGDRVVITLNGKFLSYDWVE
jgi:cyanate lyase